MSRAWSNKIMAKVNVLIDIIRKEKNISFSQLCFKGHLAPSTLHQYKKLVLEKAEDIKFYGDHFKVIPKEKKGSK